MPLPRMRRELALALICAGVCLAPATGAQTIVARDTTMLFAAPKLLTASVPGGVVEIIGEDRSDVYASLSHLPNAIVMYQRGDSLHLSIAPGIPAPQARVILRIPAGTPLRLAIPGGDVRVTGMRAAVELRPTSGRVSVDGATVVRSDGAAGRVRLTRVTGGVVVRTVTGPVTLDDIAGDIDIASRSGPLAITNGRGTTVRVHTTSGRIAWSGRLDPVGVYEFVSTSGPIALAVPQGAHVTGTIEHLRSRVSHAPSVTVVERRRIGTKEQIQWTASSGQPAAGGAHVEVRTVTGQVQVGDAGASVRPAAPRPTRRTPSRAP